MFRTLLEPFWPGRRAYAFDPFCRLTGVDDPYEEPLEPDLVIAAHEHPVEECVTLLIEHLTARGLAGTPSPARQPSAECA